MNTNNNTIVINVSVLNDLLDTANFIDESEIVSQAIGFIDHPDDSNTGDELVKAAARIYADVHFLKSEMNKVLAPLVKQ